MQAADKIAAFRNMAESDPDNELAHFSLGKLLAEAGEAARAEAPLRRAIELKPEYTVAYRWLGESLVALDRKTDALEVLEKGWRLANERGEFQPRDAIQALFEKLGESPPQVERAAPPTPTEVGPDQVLCSRCQRVGARLASAPFSSDLGKRILEKTCQNCWREWMGVSVKVINEYRLNMASAEADTVYENHLREFLVL